jgi:hypothetical protein
MKENHKINLRHNCGFFSDFLTGLAGIMYCVDNNHNFYVDWRNSFYNHQNECNLFDKYFYQDLNDNEHFTTTYNTLTPYNYYFAIAEHYDNKKMVEFLKKPSEILKDYKILNNDHFKSIDTKIFDEYKILGIHKRGTDHYVHGTIISDIEVLNCVNEEFRKNSYDKIFLITDDLDSFNFFTSELGDNLITTNSTKITSNNLGLHTNFSSDGHTLSTDVIRDSYLLSKTKFKLITKSNVSTFTLLCNLEEDNFKYIDKHINYR